ncbi:MAG TPA: hypothetical protein VGU69_07575 [Rhizomicrobium sp.]|nr:hypothetical protein [Rhizomicrobium sp.]
MKIPFEATIATSYRFAFRNVLSIFGIGWAPALLVFATSAGFVLLLLPGIRDLIAQGQKVDAAQIAAFLPEAGLALMAWALCYLVAAAMILAGVIRKALGILPGPVYFYFPLDSQVWRIVGAFLILSVLSWGVIIVAGTAIAAIAYFVSRYSDPGAGIVTGVLVTIALLAGYYALIRVQFFLPVIVVAENHISLGRSWALGRDNFWRILGILLIMIIPIGFASSTITNAFLQMYMKPIVPGMPPAQLLGDISHALIAIAPLYVVVQLIYVIFVLAFVAIAGTAAYRFVTGGESIAPPPPAKA